MGLMDMFRRQTPAADPPKGKRATRQQAADHEATVQRLRQQARRRLLGAAVLVGAAIVAFPLVFETQPRPVPMDLPIVIPIKDAETARMAGSSLPASLPQGALLETPSESKAAESANASTEPTPQASSPALAVATSQPSKPAAASEAQAETAPSVEARFVVQVGAFADRMAAQQARRKLEARGLKTYTQVAKTKDGDRIRVRLGPFADRAEADKAAAKARSAGLAANVLSL
ncbi:SPOR domain-containing protein [Inhella sp.]|uniref:SPOR domain-containing protein n=1 Tax=Inhella sp. TaxID=1921806 RepID=UPI0035AE58B2